MMQSEDFRSKALESIDDHFEKVKASQGALNPDRLLKVLYQLREIGWSKVTACDEKFEQVTLAYTEIDTEFDEQEVFHLNVIIPEGFPTTGPICTDELPATFLLPSYRWNPNKSTLGDTFSIFADRINRLAPLRRSLRELDWNCLVLDPKIPSVKILFRRIFVADGVSIHLTFKDESDFTKLPDMLFLGPENKLQTLRQNLIDRSDLYDPGVSIVKNIQSILRVSLPGPDFESDKAHEGLDCGICYCYIVNDLPPTRVCNCGVQFHADCLYEWLRSVPDNRETLQTFFGKCPYCEKSISCPVVIP